MISNLTSINPFRLNLAYLPDYQSVSAGGYEPIYLQNYRTYPNFIKAKEYKILKKEKVGMDGGGQDIGAPIPS